jgi:lysophospholipase L1-like esterase
MELSPDHRARRLALYTAVGDSFTAGTGTAAGQAWPELLAAGLRARNPGFRLRNLAVEGATSDEVLDQLPEAVELEPDLVTVVCGANDVLRCTRPDVERYASNLGEMLGRLRRSVPGVRIATATSPEAWEFMALGPRTRRRVEHAIAEVNGATRLIARAFGVPCLEVAGHPGLGDAENFGDDGLHPSALGHERAAAGFAALLADHYGIETAHQGGET